jgi:hypothetical protein
LRRTTKRGLFYFKARRSLAFFVVVPGGQATDELHSSPLTFSSAAFVIQNMSNMLSELSVKQLKQAIRLREKIEALQTKLDHILGSSGTTPAAKGKPGRKPRRKMSAAAKAKISAAAKKRWAKAKAAGKSRL